MTPPVNPRPFLASLVGKKIVVKLKWGMEYRGELMCADLYMNLQMANVVEFMDNEEKGTYEELLIRCNNILFIREKSDIEVVKKKKSVEVKEEVVDITDQD